MIVGIIGAMEKEIILLKEKMTVEKIEENASLTFYIGQLHGKTVVLVRSGIGKVNAAMCTQILIDIYHVEVVINTGVAGALHPDLQVGDIVVSIDTLQHDIDASVFGDPRGIIPGMVESVFLADQRLLEIIDQITLHDQKILKGECLLGIKLLDAEKQKPCYMSNFKDFV